MLYEKLNPDMQRTVDAYAGRLRVLDWGRRGDLLAESALPFGQDLPPDKATVAARGFITAVLERLGAPEISDPRQALLYLASLDPEHREKAEIWLASHPDMQAAVDDGLEGLDEG
jgi:hypothetical protein